MSVQRFGWLILNFFFFCFEVVVLFVFFFFFVFCSFTLVTGIGSSFAFSAITAFTFCFFFFALTLLVSFFTANGLFSKLLFSISEHEIANTVMAAMIKITLVFTRISLQTR